MNRFEGKHIIVTGGTGGIGLATAERLLDEGATVLLTGRDAAKIEELAARDRVHAIANDSSDPDAASALAEAAKTHLGGRVDGVFLNAGYGGFAPLGEIRGEDFERMMNVNVRAPLLQLGALSPLLSEGAAILFNSSIVNDMKMPGSAVYAATKGAVRSAMNAVSAEMAGRGIRVNAVSPGPDRHRLLLGHRSLRRRRSRASASRFSPKCRSGASARRARSPRRWRSCSPSDASYVHATELVVDGGMS